MNEHLQQYQQWQQQAQSFWQAWLVDYPRLQTCCAIDIVEDSNAILQAHFEGIVFELEGGNEQAANRFEQAAIVFSANGITERFPQVQALCAAIPPGLPCVVRAFRSALSETDQFTIGMNGFNLAISDLTVRLSSWREMPALDIAFTQTIDAEMMPHAQNMCFIMLDHILGEWNSAIKIGAVDFVDGAEADFYPMHQLPEKLHSMWLELGRNGVYPKPEWQYANAHIEADEENEQDELVLTRNQSANSLLGRADMAWVLSISCQIGSKTDLEDAYNLQDTFDAYAAQHQQGINTLSIMNMTRGQRTIFAATSQPEILLSQALKLCAQYPHLNAQAQCEYDPTWDHYRL